MLKSIFNKHISPWKVARMCSFQYQVKHDHKLKEFSLGNGEDKAVLQYKELESSCIELEHTIVPQSLQGKGIGKLLAEAAFEYALDKNLKVKVTCGFVQSYLQRNPKSEFKNILTE